MEKRAAFRFPSNVEADCRSCEQGWATRLVNISTTGCMISCPIEDLPDGVLLRLRIKGLTAIDGEIVWQHRNHAGVRFHAELHPAVMEHLTYRGCDGSAEIKPAPAGSDAVVAQLRPAPGLTGGLVKRTWAPVDEAPRSAVSAH